MSQKLEARGGNGGEQWDDGAEHESVSKIYIREGRDGIVSIKFWSNPWWLGPKFHRFDLKHTIDEHIVSIKCYYDEGVIQGLVIKTNIRTSALMGYNLGTKFKLEVKGKKITGFHGSSDQNLNSLGAYFTTFSPGDLEV
ncbi:Jacalin-like lectin domain-containing protein [Hirschfeldia incana]|nr:Jacalin-like lectin domain-containing protein [Hirschfeldia incana]